MSVPKFVLYKGQKLKNGEHPVRLRIYQGSEFYVSVGLSCKPNEWDDVARRFTTLKPSYRSLNNFLDKKEEEATVIWSKLEPFDITRFKLKWMDSGSESVGEFLEFLKDKLTFGNYLKYRNMFLVLDNFAPDLKFSQIDKMFLKKFEDYLTLERKFNGEPLKHSTIRGYFATLATMYNKAIEYEWVDYKLYPFKNAANPNGFSFAKYKHYNPKPRAISRDTIIRLKNLEINDSLKFSRDLFIFSYLSRGMSFVDMAHLKESNIINNRIHYVRKKTKHEVPSILITPDMKEIMDRYKGESGYVFPIIKLPYNYWQVIHACKKFNTDLKELGTLIGSEIKLTSYVSRYSFANIAIDSGADIRELKDLMGHADINTTVIYVNEVKKSELDKFQNLL